MKSRVLSLALLLGANSLLYAQGTPRMTAHATGTFDVRTTQQAADDPASGGFERRFIDKTFHGALEGTSKGTMLGFHSADKTGAAYVALELVTAILDGREGSFVLQHSGTMRGGERSLSVTVVPGSGTRQLAGLIGTLRIIVDGNQHRYDFAYSFQGSTR